MTALSRTLILIVLLACTSVERQALAVKAVRFPCPARSAGTDVLPIAFRYRHLTLEAVLPSASCGALIPLAMSRTALCQTYRTRLGSAQLYMLMSLQC
jgi:hypothetical protein